MNSYYDKIQEHDLENFAIDMGGELKSFGLNYDYMVATLEIDNEDVRFYIYDFEVVVNKKHEKFKPRAEKFFDDLFSFNYRSYSEDKLAALSDKLQ